MYQPAECRLLQTNHPHACVALEGQAENTYLWSGAHGALCQHLAESRHMEDAQWILGEWLGEAED